MYRKSTRTFLFLFTFAILFSQSSFAQKKIRRSGEGQKTLTYDLGASVGSYNGNSYSELTFGLNAYLTDFMIWRNALFTRFGSNIDSVTGLDTSIRFFYDSRPEAGSLGITLFAGPGYRISAEKNSAFFAEGGAVLKVVGLSLGGGMKSMIYTNPGKDSKGVDLPKSDTIYFIILAGGGVF